MTASTNTWEKCQQCSVAQQFVCQTSGWWPGDAKAPCYDKAIDCLRTDTKTGDTVARQGH